MGMVITMTTAVNDGRQALSRMAHKGGQNSQATFVEGRKSVLYRGELLSKNIEKTREGTVVWQVVHRTASF